LGREIKSISKKVINRLVTSLSLLVTSLSFYKHERVVMFLKEKKGLSTFLIILLLDRIYTIGAIR